METKRSQVLVAALSSAFLVLLVKAPLVLAGFNETSELYRELFTEKDQRVRPALNASVPTDVNVQLNLLSLREIVETEQYFVINAWVDFSWRDEIRTWDPALHGGVRVLYPGPQGMWMPRVIVSNSITTRDLFDDDYAPLSVSWDGSASWRPGTVFSLACIMDMTYFPFDRQNCVLTFLAQEYGSDVNLISSGDTANTRSYDVNGEWHLEATRAQATKLAVGTVTFSTLEYTFTFRRRPTFFLLNVLFPVVLLTLLTPLVFVLPEESGERVSFAVTLLLSLSVFMSIVAGELPQSSDTMPMTVVYIFVMLIHSGLCVVCTVVHLRWQQYTTQDGGQQQQTTADNTAEEQLQPKQQRQQQQQDKGQKQTEQSPNIFQRLHRGSRIMNSDPFQVAFNNKNNEFSNAGSRLKQNGLVDPGDTDIVQRSRKGKPESCEPMTNGEPALSRFSLKTFCSANIVLCAIFYIVWFVLSAYFFIRIMS